MTQHVARSHGPRGKGLRGRQARARKVALSRRFYLPSVVDPVGITRTSRLA